MTPQEIIERVKKYHATEHVFPLLCKLFSDHGPLEPREQDGKVILFCTGCDYVQCDIPPVVFGVAVDAMYSAQQFMQGEDEWEPPRDALRPPARKTAIKIAGIDAGSTLVKACWMHEGEYTFISSADTGIEHIRYAMQCHGINRLHLAGIGKLKGVADGFETVRPRVDARFAEISLQADGAKRLLAMDGEGDKDFLLVSIGTGTSYTFVHKGRHQHFPLGNALGGGTLKKRADMMGLPLFREFIELAGRGEHLDLLIKEAQPDLDDGFIGELILSYLGKVTAGAFLQDLAATEVHGLAATLVRDVALIGQTRDAPPFETVFFTGSTVSRVPKLRQYLTQWTARLGKTARFHRWGEFALALGAYHHME